MGLLLLLVVPLVALNVLGGVVSGIWLAFLGEWGALGIGATAFFVSAFALAFVLMPSLGLMAAAEACEKNGNWWGLFLFRALGSGYTLSVVAVWCSAVFLYLTDSVAARALLPTLVWAYGVATGPWVYMASKETGPEADGGASTITVFFAQIAAAVVACLLFFGVLSPRGVFAVFGTAMGLSFACQMITSAIVVSERRRRTKLLKLFEGRPDIIELLDEAHEWDRLARRVASGELDLIWAEMEEQSRWASWAAGGEEAESPQDGNMPIPPPLRDVSGSAAGAMGEDPVIDTESGSVELTEDGTPE